MDIKFNDTFYISKILEKMSISETILLDIFTLGMETQKKISNKLTYDDKRNEKKEDVHKT